MDHLINAKGETLLWLTSSLWTSLFKETTVKLKVNDIFWIGPYPAEGSIGYKRQKKTIKKNKKANKKQQNKNRQNTVEHEGSSDSSYNRGVMVIAAGNGYGDMSSNPGRDWLHFT